MSYELAVAGFQLKRVRETIQAAGVLIDQDEGGGWYWAVLDIIAPSDIYPTYEEALYSALIWLINQAKDEGGHSGQ